MMEILVGMYKHPGAFRKFQALVLPILMAISCHAQKIATLEVNLNSSSLGLEIPVQINLDPITHLQGDALSLVEIQGKKRVPVIFQVEDGQQRKLTWLVNDQVKKHVYELIKSGASLSANARPVKAVKEDGSLTLKADNRNLIRYHYKPVYPPKGIDTVFKRSAFIHPLWSPHGQVLTRIQAPDHYHHYGLWNPWTHVLYEGDTVDFWNLKGKQGTVRFADFISVTTGNIFGEYAALHEHVVFRKGKSDKVALQEVQTVRVYVPQNNSDYYIADVTVQLNCPTSPVRLLKYRYGGMGWRATEQWTKDNSSVLSSEGKTRKDADGSKARWCIVQGTVDQENAGAVMMSYPVNYNHPEPLRIWPENANNRGDMFANFSPTKDMDWALEPGKNHVLKYRFIVFNGEFSKEKAEAAWQYFAQPPTVRVIKTAG
jgi:hypothetical protein